MEYLKDFISKMVMLNIRSRYMCYLYNEMQVRKRYLNSTDEDDFLLNAAIVSATSSILSNFSKKLFSQVSEQYIERLNSEEYREDVKKFIMSTGRDTSYDYGKFETTFISSTLSNKYKMNNFDNMCNQIFAGFLNSNDVIETRNNLNGLVLNVESLSIDEKQELLDKILITFKLHSCVRKKPVIVDREYSKIKYPNDSFDNVLDYRSLLESIGMDMGDIPRTFIEVFEGKYNSKRR